MAEVSKRIIQGLSEKSLDGSHGDRATSHYCIEFPEVKTASLKILITIIITNLVIAIVVVNVIIMVITQYWS